MSVSSSSPARWRRAGWVALGLVLGWQAAAAAGLQATPPPKTPAATNPPAPPKAAFAVDLPGGKDPFFPETRRLKASAPVGQTAPASGLQAGDQLKLKGISLGAKHRRLALVNNQTLAEGETAPVKLLSGTVVIQCLEIRENSVLVLLPATREVKELSLPKDTSTPRL